MPKFWPGIQLLPFCKPKVFRAHVSAEEGGEVRPPPSRASHPSLGVGFLARFRAEIELHTLAPPATFSPPPRLCCRGFRRSDSEARGPGRGPPLPPTPSSSSASPPPWGTPWARLPAFAGVLGSGQQVSPQREGGGLVGRPAAVCRKLGFPLSSSHPGIRPFLAQCRHPGGSDLWPSERLFARVACIFFSHTHKCSCPLPFFALFCRTCRTSWTSCHK